MAFSSKNNSERFLDNLNLNLIDQLFFLDVKKNRPLQNYKKVFTI